MTDWNHSLNWLSNLNYEWIAVIYMRPRNAYLQVLMIVIDNFILTLHCSYFVNEPLTPIATETSRKFNFINGDGDELTFNCQQNVRRQKQ